MADGDSAPDVGCALVTANSAALPVIAVDGPAGSGKSSTSRGVAAALGLRYLDTGAMYRAITWALLQRGIDVSDSEAVAKRVDEPELVMSVSPEGQSVLCDGVDVTTAIRSPEVTGAVSAVSAVPQVRSRLVALQQQSVLDALDAGVGIVVEGRDIGTVVLPDARLKVFLTADEAARAWRRALEDARRVGSESPEVEADAAANEVRRRLAERDAVDSGRAVSPLQAANDAIVVDGSELTLDEVVGRIVALARERWSDV